MMNNQTYIYIYSNSNYFWVEENKFIKESDVISNLMITKKELYNLRREWNIQEFNDICYLKWWKEWCFNLLNNNDILKPSDNPILHKDIELLINNLCWYKSDNIEYLHKALLYKYLNINNHIVPAVVFYWAGWSWKWTYISLLSTIFWDNNVLQNLWQKELSSDFDTYTWAKIIVSFNEISTNNTASDMRLTNKLKNIICEDTLIVNVKNQKQYQINNIAWVFISSNSNKPIKLDSREKWNRRFTIIKSTKSLREKWWDINKSVKDKNIVSDYIARLLVTYPEVKDFKVLTALNNNDKRELEELSRQEVDNFWDRVISDKKEMIKNYKLTIHDIRILQDEYCIMVWLNEYEFWKYFWNNSRFIKKKIRLDANNITYGVQFLSEDLIYEQ